MYRYVGPVVSAIEKLDLDQVLRRKRPSSRWGPPFGMVFARRSSPCSSLPTLPEAASAVLVSSPGAGCCSRFLVKIIVPISYVFVRIDTYQADMCHEKNRVGEQVAFNPRISLLGTWWVQRPSEYLTPDPISQKRLVSFWSNCYKYVNREFERLSGWSY